MSNGEKSIARIFSGIILVILGLFLLIGELAELSWGEHFWPIFLLLGGMLFYSGYFSVKARRSGSEGLLFPGTYLIILGGLFLLLNFIGWEYMRYLWPTFVFGVAVSLWVVRSSMPIENAARRKSLKSSIITLSLISAIFYLMALKVAVLWPVAIIVIGIIIIAKGLTKF